MKWFKLLFSLVITLVLFYLLNFSRGKNIPFAPGEFLNPFAGFWQNNIRTDKIPEDLRIPGLADSVVVLWDERQVPHIFAQNFHDLYLAQGYLTARERLWQMDFVAHAAAGRVSEIIGPNPDVIQYDLYRRRLGIIYAAENSLRMMLKDSDSRTALNAYANGVNAWIDQLEERDWPIEFKILNYEPEPWTPLKSALLLKHMAWDLTGQERELSTSRTRAILGDSLMNVLYFRPHLFLNPVIPRGTSWKFKPLPIPGAPETIYQIAAPENLFPFQPDPDNGSNNWAVSGKKTQSGYPILCSDPHLGLTLPSVWYEVQLVSPEVNVYGVSLPGAPTVIVGFNRNIAWGLTNAHTDVLDWYDTEFDKSNWKYYYDGRWENAVKRLERIKVRGGRAILDTLAITRHGPIVYRQGEKPVDEGTLPGTALRWAGHDPSNELAAFLKLNRAKNYADFEEALSAYDCPGQNFVFGASDGDIAMQHNGKFPLRWEGQGRYIGDGSDPAYDWKGWIPREQLPKAKNPPEGFLASANQPPTDGSYPYFLNGKYATFERSKRINERLETLQNITPQDMMALQQDILNVRAQTALPSMIRILEQQDLSLADVRYIDVLKQWDFKNQRESIAATIFEYWWENTHKLFWEDEFPGDPGQYRLPDDDATLNIILNDTANVFIDATYTGEIETIGNIMLFAFEESLRQLAEKFGPLGDNWKWGSARGTDIPHLARINGFGRANLKTDGNHDIVNAIKKSHGPSWRMVVQLGPSLKAWGIYPGGQSGNPGSPEYDKFITDWVNGKYYELHYLGSPNETLPQLQAKTILRGSK